ncbi:hypothetical protein ACFOGI_06620 [Virgibacillus xinjiangensis]|uniref:Uncharacterized protein n=1 Tax=Virgibacillus xinjiangensis TaxID=393090 RepID=A0ABV7CTY0_9BACI
MPEISSYEIELDRNIGTQDIIALHHYCSKSHLNIYLYRDNLIADAGNLPKLLSFFYFNRKNQPFVMILDGENVKEGYREIHSLLKEKTIHEELRANHKMTGDKSVAI